MLNEMLNRFRVAGHGRDMEQNRGSDPLPIVGRAMALVLAVAFASLTVTTTGSFLN